MARKKKNSTQYERLLEQAHNVIVQAIRDDPARAKEIIIDFMDEDTKLSRRISEDLDLDELLSQINIVLFVNGDF